MHACFYWLLVYMSMFDWLIDCTFMFYLDVLLLYAYFVCFDWLALSDLLANG